MTFGDIVTPWLALAAVLAPLIYIEKWIHSHLYGVGWLMSRGNPRTATALYYVILFPGVFVHEFTQYLVAGALNVRIKKVVAWPEAQNNGTLRLDFVRIQKARWYQAALVGAAPIFVGTALVWLISNRVLNLTELLDAFGKGDITLMGAAVENLGSTPDFYIWLYLIFAISNAMFPTSADRRGWPLFIGAFAVAMVALMILGVNPDVLMGWYKENIAAGLEIMTTAFSAVLVVAVFTILVIGFTEEILEYFTKRKFDYGRRTPAGTRRRSGREPGSADPLPFDVPLPSIYATHLPIPDPAKRSQLPPRKNAPALAPVTATTTAGTSAGTTRAQPPLRSPTPVPGAPALVEPARSTTSRVPDHAPSAGAASFRREDQPASPPPNRFEPAARSTRPDQPFDPNITTAGDINRTQRLTPPATRSAPVSPGAPAPTGDFRRPSAASRDEPTASPRPVQPTGMAPRPIPAAPASTGDFRRPSAASRDEPAVSPRPAQPTGIAPRPIPAAPAPTGDFRRPSAASRDEPAAMSPRPAQPTGMAPSERRSSPFTAPFDDSEDDFNADSGDDFGEDDELDADNDLMDDEGSDDVEYVDFDDI